MRMKIDRINKLKHLSRINVELIEDINFQSQYGYDKTFEALKLQN